MPDTEKASLNGLYLEVETLQDGFRKSIVQQEFPLRDGAELDDMGQTARIVRLRCYFWDDTYQGHYDLIELLKEQELLELDHPRYGLLQGMVKSVDVRHDDREWTAEIDLTFIENLRGETQPVYQEDVGGKTAAIFESGSQEQMEELANDMLAALGTEAEKILSKVLDASKGILEQFTDLTGKARSFVSKIDSTVNTLEATLNKISNPANSLIATIDFGVNLPGRVVGAVTRTAERYTILYDSLKSAPERFIQGFHDAMTALKTTLGLNEGVSGIPKTSTAEAAAQATMSKQIDLTGSSVAAQQLGEIYADDEADRQQVRQTENAKSFDAEGNYIKLETVPVILTINQIEKSLAVTREYLQAAIDQAREMQALKDLARSLLKHANTIKLEREKIVQVELDNPMPLHLVCLKYGLPHNYAERIWSINPQLKNPNFTSGTVSVYAR